MNSGSRDINPYAPPQVQPLCDEVAQTVPTITMQFVATQSDWLAADMGRRVLFWKWRLVRATFIFATIPISLALLMGIAVVLHRLGLAFDLVLILGMIGALAGMWLLAYVSNKYFLHPILAKQAAHFLAQWLQTQPGLTFGEWTIALEPEELLVQDARGGKFRFPLAGATITRLFHQNQVCGFIFFSRKSDLIVIPTSAKCSVPWPVLDRTLHARCR